MVFTRRQSKSNKNTPKASETKSTGASSVPASPSANVYARLKKTPLQIPATSAISFYNAHATTSSTSLVAPVDHGVDVISKMNQGDFDQRTPQQSSPMKPESSEMHPQRHKRSSITPYDEARWLGFFNKQPRTEPSKIGHNIHNLNPGSPTPVKVSGSVSASKGSDKAPEFAFTFNRESSLGLSEEAKKVMEKTRVEASRIRAQLAAEAEQQQQAQNSGLYPSALGRKIAKPKGRFSDAHSSSFQKMASIADHASAWRVKQAGPKQTALEKAMFSPGDSRKQNNPQNLRLSPLKRTRSKVDLNSPFTSQSSSPNTDERRASGNFAKRLKKTMGDDAGSRRPIDKSEVHIKAKPAGPVGMLRSNLLTPTKSSLARSKSAANLHGSRIPSSLPRMKSTSSWVATPARNLTRNGTATVSTAPRPSHRVPTQEVKVVPPPPSHVQGRFGLMKSPSTQSLVSSKSVRIMPPPQTPHTPQIPSSKPTHVKAPEHAKPQKLDSDPAPPPPALQSPMPNSTFSKIKSILRTPQRLYSNDPGKIAAGTHLATPPKLLHLTRDAPATVPVQKHVVFSASALIKASRDEAKAQSEEPEVIYPIIPASEPRQPLRRGTMAIPTTTGDFTFRAGSPIKFASPLTSTIRAVPPTEEVSPTPNKRKRNIDDVGMSSDGPEQNKENASVPNDERPAKRARIVSTTIARQVKKFVPKSRPGASKTPKRTVGGISASRLAFLSQPKKRD
ncbi:hypothetical protein BT63DRAFT_440635 [Microthyrium microscopicum]|uniref:Erythromycin esterase n=1 Tax=Microthyrium microscopicum TaxID=703497 RepID=A0A6A6U881_9PEZI|nr:hypothetical protein BT63DRAFT_440635 [Microthyrium microscopicum]